MSEHLSCSNPFSSTKILRGYGAIRSPVCFLGQGVSVNFWKVWQSSLAWPRLTAKVQVTSLT